MIRSKTIVAAAVFFTILLSSAGCYRPSLDLILDHSEAADAQTTQTDGGIDISSPDVDLAPDSEVPSKPLDVLSHRTYQEPFAILTTERETPNQAFTLPYEIRQAFAHNMQVWLFSYESPPTSFAHDQENLTVLLSYPRESYELVSTPSSVGQIRAFVALPEGWTPLFNVRITSPAGDHYLALDGRDDLFPRLQGDVQIYAVHPGGSYHASPPVLACRDMHASEDQPAGLVPGGACPEIVDSCPVLYELTCHHL